LHLQTALAERVVDDEDRLVERERLLDEIEGAHLDGADRGLDVAVTGDEHDRRVDLPFAQPLPRGQALHAGQPAVKDTENNWPARQALETGSAARDGLYGVAFVVQDASECRPNAGFVVDDQNRGLHRVFVVMANGYGRWNCRTISPSSIIHPISH